MERHPCSYSISVENLIIDIDLSERKEKFNTDYEYTVYLTTEFANDRVGFLYPKTTSAYPYQNYYAIFKLF
jgi:hypothetical protein